MRLDFLIRPMPFVLAFTALQVTSMVLYWRHVIGGTVFYFASTLVFSMLIGFVVLRPMGSAQAIAGVWGKTCYEPGDFSRAFGQLPVSRELVLRTVWLHGIITGGLLWLAIVLTGAFNARVALGQAVFFTDSRGRFIGEIVLPMLALVPCAAAFLVEGAAGDRKMAYVSGALFVLSPQILFAMLMLGAPRYGAAVMMAVIALAGSLPVFRHFTPAAEPA